MSNTRYLEIDSTYRNRKQYPNPSDFTVLISQSGTRNAVHAYDPVCNSAPLITWVPHKFSSPTATPPGSAPDGVVLANTSNTTSKFIVSFPTGLVQLPDYYIGQPIQVSTNTTIITELQYINTTSGGKDNFWINVSPSLPTPPPPTVTSVYLTGSTDIPNGIFYVPQSPNADNFYVGYVLWNDTQQNGIKIINYNGSNHQIGVDSTSPVLATWTITDSYSIRKESPVFTGSLVVITPNIIQLPPNASNLTDIYAGNFIRIVKNGGLNDDATYRIMSYDGETKRATINSNLITPTTDLFELLYFSRDNVVPFTYTGSLVSQQEMVCYQIELVNLILPNKTLKNGGRIAFYPYVYVELQNVSSAGAGTKDIIYSNNPNATRRLFKAIIDDIPNPFVSPFVKIDGDGMVQTIKFKPNDNFKFGVYLPNGLPFETVCPEWDSPLSTNPFIQISALFSIKRL